MDRQQKKGGMEVITKMERLVKEDMAEFILEELNKYDCVPEGKKVTAMNVITKALVDIRRCKARIRSQEQNNT